MSEEEEVQDADDYDSEDEIGGINEIFIYGGVVAALFVVICVYCQATRKKQAGLAGMLPPGGRMGQSGMVRPYDQFNQMGPRPMMGQGHPAASRPSNYSSFSGPSIRFNSPQRPIQDDWYDSAMRSSASTWPRAPLAMDNGYDLVCSSMLPPTLPARNQQVMPASQYAITYHDYDVVSRPIMGVRSGYDTFRSTGSVVPRVIYDTIPSFAPRRPAPPPPQPSRYGFSRQLQTVENPYDIVENFYETINTYDVPMIQRGFF